MAAPLVALVIAGCGGGGSGGGGAEKHAAVAPPIESAANFRGEQEKVAQVLEQEEQANNAKDATKMCDLYSTSSTSFDCTGNADMLLRERGTMERTVKKVTIASDGSSAEAETTVTYSTKRGAPARESIHLEADGDNWKIATFSVESG